MDSSYINKQMNKLVETMRTLRGIAINIHKLLLNAYNDRSLSADSRGAYRAEVVLTGANMRIRGRVTVSRRTPPFAK